MRILNEKAVVKRHRDATSIISWIENRSKVIQKPGKRLIFKKVFLFDPTKIHEWLHL